MTFLSPHFELQELAGGVYAALDCPDGAAHSNAGIIDLGGLTLIFDSFLTLTAGEDLRQAGEALTERPAGWLVNSHYHLDHIVGNQLFTGTALLSTAETRRLMQEEVGVMVPGWKKNPAPLLDEIRQMTDLAVANPGTLKAEGACLQAGFDRHLLDTLPGLRLTLPDHTFTGRMALHGSQRSAHLLCLGPAHTAGDCVLVLPAERTAFLGDVGFFGTTPFTARGDIGAWLRAIDELLALPLDTFVPGHGPVGGRGELMLQKGYLEAIRSLAEQARQAGMTVEQACEQRLPEPYASWPDPWMGIIMEANLTRLLA